MSSISTFPWTRLAFLFKFLQICTVTNSFYFIPPINIKIILTHIHIHYAKNLFVCMSLKKKNFPELRKWSFQQMRFFSEPYQ